MDKSIGPDWAQDIQQLSYYACLFNRLMEAETLCTRGAELYYDPYLNQTEKFELFEKKWSKALQWVLRGVYYRNKLKRILNDARCTPKGARRDNAQVNLALLEALDLEKLLWRVSQLKKVVINLKDKNNDNSD